MQEPRRSVYLEYGRRPLAYISVRATGFDPNIDRIVEVAVVKHGFAYPTRTYERLVYPGVPILAQATEFHGVSDSDVASAKPFGAIARGLLRFLGAANLAGFGIRRLAVPLLVAEFGRLGLVFKTNRAIIDLKDIDEHHHPRDLKAAVGRYLGRELRTHADALDEAVVSKEILDAQVNEHEDLPTFVPAIANYPFRRTSTGLFRRGSDLRPIIFAEGRHRGRTPDEVALLDPDYLKSLLGRGLIWPEHWGILDALAKLGSTEANSDDPALGV